MSLKKEFQEFINTKPVPPYATLPKSGIDVEWNELMKGWKVDMGMRVDEFLLKNPDLLENIRTKHPELIKHLELGQISTRTIMKRGLAEAILNEMIEATDLPAGEADRIFKGQRLRSIASGTLTADARDKLYEDAFKAGQLPARTSINPQGGVRQASPEFNEIVDFHEGAKPQRMKRLRKAGLIPADPKDGELVYIDPTGDGTLANQAGDEWVIWGKGKHRRLKNKTAFNDTRKALDPRTGKVGSRYAIRRRYESKRKRDLVPQTEADRKAIDRTMNAIAEYNNGENPWGVKLEDGDPRYLIKEHVVGKNTWKRVGLPGSAERDSNVAPNALGEARQKTNLENRLIAAEYEGRYSVDWDPSTKSLWIDPTTDFKPGVHGDKSIEIKNVNGNYDIETPLRKLRAIRSATNLRKPDFGTWTGKLGKADAAIRFASGDYIGGGMGLAFQNKRVQRAIAKSLAKSGAKLAPGVGITLSGLETAGYTSQGRWTQAGISALSGLVGEVPVVGDLVSTGLDLTNTFLDLAHGGIGTSGMEMDDIQSVDRRYVRNAAKASRNLSFL